MNKIHIYFGNTENVNVMQSDALKLMDLSKVDRTLGSCTFIKNGAIIIDREPNDHTSRLSMKVLMNTISYIYNNFVGIYDLPFVAETSTSSSSSMMTTTSTKVDKNNNHITEKTRSNAMNKMTTEEISQNTSNDKVKNSDSYTTKHLKPSICPRKNNTDTFNTFELIIYLPKLYNNEYQENQFQNELFKITNNIIIVPHSFY